MIQKIVSKKLLILAGSHIIAVEVHFFLIFLACVCTYLLVYIFYSGGYSQISSNFAYKTGFRIM